jgi:hypothetical protein
MSKPAFEVGAFVMYLSETPGIVTANEREHRYTCVRVDKTPSDIQVFRDNHGIYDPRVLRKGTFFEYLFKRNGYVGKWTPFDFYIRVGLVLSMYAGLVFGGSGISLPWYITAYAVVTAIGAAIVLGAYAQFKQLQS